MATELFGTDGIRGPAGVYPLDQAGATQIGRAVAAQFAQPGELILVGRDPRESSPWLSETVIEGLVALGARVEDVGVLPTPGLAYLTKQRQARAGVMITASHNLYTDNGIKVFTADGVKLLDEIQAGLNQLVSEEISDRSGGSCKTAPKAVEAYREFLVGAGGVSLAEWRLAVDTANGATSGLAARVFEELGATVTAVFDQPDGKNINVNCGATEPAALQSVVKKQQLTAGMAFDGDGDRLTMIDEKGRELTGDHILYILAVCGKESGVVATLMSNRGLETTLKARHIVLHRTDVGDRAVLEGLANTGLNLGGEQSGHIILGNYSRTGDGLLAAIRVLAEVQASGRSLAEWYDELQLLPQALVNISLTDKSLLNHPEVLALIADFSKKLNDHGRLNVRPSGTEPKLRVMVESPDAAECAQDIADQLSQLLDSLEQNS